jgi:hypothetical protein
MQPRPGEDMGQFRTRIAQRVAETQWIMNCLM